MQKKNSPEGGNQPSKNRLKKLVLNIKKLPGKTKVFAVNRFMIGKRLQRRSQERQIRRSKGRVVFLSASVLVIASAAMLPYVSPYLYSGYKSLMARFTESSESIVSENIAVLPNPVEAKTVPTSNWRGVLAALGGAIVVKLAFSLWSDGSLPEIFSDPIEYIKSLCGAGTETIEVTPPPVWSLQDYTNAGVSCLFYSANVVAVVFRKSIVSCCITPLAGPAASAAVNFLIDLCFGPSPVFGPMMPIPITETADPSSFMALHAFCNRTIFCVWRNSKYLISG